MYIIDMQFCIPAGIHGNGKILIIAGYGKRGTPAIYNEKSGL